MSALDNRPLIAGLELGGTKCVALLASGPDDVRARETIPTRDPESTLAAIDSVLATAGRSRSRPT